VRNIFNKITALKFKNDFDNDTIIIYDHNNNNKNIISNELTNLVKFLCNLYMQESHIIIIDQQSLNFSDNIIIKLFDYISNDNKQIIINTYNSILIVKKYIKYFMLLNNNKIYTDIFNGLSESKLNLVIGNNKIFCYQYIIFVEGVNDYLFLSAYKDFLYGAIKNIIIIYMKIY
jgi:hypothetical protein